MTAVHRVAQSRTRLKLLSMHALEKGLATHSSVLAWRTLGTGKPGGLPSMGLQSRTRLKQRSSSSSSSSGNTHTLISFVSFSFLPSFPDFPIAFFLFPRIYH